MRSRIYTCTLTACKKGLLCWLEKGTCGVIFRKLFGDGGGRRDEPTLPVVRNVTIGRSVRLDPLSWRRLGPEARFKLETDSLGIAAQGLINLGADGYVHRFYTDDDVMLQVTSPDYEGRLAEDVTLFVPWSSAYPADGAAKRRWADRLRARAFEEDGLPAYPRFWFGDADERQDPVSFWEDVYDDRDMRAARRIYQTCMLFGRDLPGDGRELLLAIEMQPDGGDLTHEVMIGIPLAPGEFEA